MNKQDLKTSITGYTQAVVAILSALGVIISPESADAIVAGSLALMGILSAIKGHYTKDK